VDSDFLKFTTDNHVPVDFVSTHGYADDTVEDLFGTNEDIPMDERVCRAAAKVHGRNQSVWQAGSSAHLVGVERAGHDGLARHDLCWACSGEHCAPCDGLVNMLSFWTFSDVFEEGGPIAKPFVGMFGLRAKGGINKPSYYAYGLLHQLGNERMANASKNVIVTKTANGGLAIAAWNLVDPGQHGSTQDHRF
jgi:xylan 1,4-beta-xylosidase